MKRILVSCLLSSAAATLWAATPPSFHGGEEALTAYLNANVVYPKFARENGIEGTVTVLFTVLPDGKITGIKVARPLDPDLEAEAVRLVREMPAWTPGVDDSGSPVSAEASLPVKFRLSN